MKTPVLIFGVLLAAAVVYCSATDASSTLPPRTSEESRSVQDENVIGLSPNDPVASCGHEKNQLGKRCREFKRLNQATSESASLTR